MTSSRSNRFDLLKTIAIISVIFYHIGIQKYGYLGVDIFFVVGGFFLGKSILNRHNNGSFSFFSFLFQRILRLWPLLLIGGAVSLILGAICMLPDDYENLAQSVVASNFFANNILAAITTKNYWDVVNDFKPLMHTWYVGVLVQSYFVFALVPKIAGISKRYSRQLCRAGFFAVFVMSLLLFLLPVLKDHEKFYYFPARLFEIGLGVLLAALPSDTFERISRTLAKNTLFVLQILLFAALALLIALPFDFMPAALRLLLVNGFTGLLILVICCDDRDWRSPLVTGISFVGKASFSFFVWHQIIIAFIKYAWCARFTAVHILICLVLTCIVSIPSYILLESKLSNAMKNKTKMRGCLIAFAVLLLISTAGSLFIIKKAGYVRDVPELGINTSTISSGMHASYCDRVYRYNKEFSEGSKTKVLVIGNSFGRDFGNILLESKYADEIELSYARTVEEAGNQRINAAEIIFYVIFGNQFQSLPKVLEDSDTLAKTHVVGNKNFGDNNGNIYNRRHRDDYYDSAITLTKDYFSQNNRLQQVFKEAYIDLITPVQKEDGTIRVFTDDGKFISQDCRHLTVFGAQYYAKLLDLDSVFSR